MSLLDVFGRIFNAAVAGRDSSPVATIGASVVTAGQVRAGFAAMKAFNIAGLEKAVAEKLGNLADDEALANDVLGFLAAAGVPGAGELEMVAKLAEILLPFAVEHAADGPVSANADPLGRGGRRGR
jgi:hypothetical protein